LVRLTCRAAKPEKLGQNPFSYMDRLRHCRNEERPMTIFSLNTVRRGEPTTCLDLPLTSMNLSEVPAALA
jgi:hypothetical protein